MQKIDQDDFSDSLFEKKKATKQISALMGYEMHFSLVMVTLLF